MDPTEHRIGAPNDERTGRGTPPRVLNRRTLALALLFALVTLINAILVTNWIFDITRPGMLGVAYDDLGASLLRGEAHVRPSSICWEYFRVDGETYMYFGPFPALLRILPNALFPQMYGHWSRLSCLAAAATGQLAFLWMLIRTIGSSARGQGARGDLAIALLFVAFCFGTPYPFLLTAPAIYQESVLWGFGLSVVAICSLAAPARLEGKHVLVFSIASAGSFLSKATFGLPLYLLAGTLFVAGLPFAPAWLRRHSPELDGLRLRSTARWVAAFLPIVAAGLLHAGYNFERFGNPFSFIDFGYRQGGVSNSARFVAEHGAFNLRRLPVLAHYHFLSIFELSPQFPFIGYTYLTKPQRMRALLMNRQPMLSLLMSCGWLMLLGAYGLRTAVSEARRHLLFPAMGLLLLLQSVIILTYYVVSLRYGMELLPLLVFGFVLFLRSPGARGLGRHSRLKQTVFALAVAQAVWTQFAIAYQHVADRSAASFAVEDKAALLVALGSTEGVDGRVARFQRSCARRRGMTGNPP